MKVVNHSKFVGWCQWSGMIDNILEVLRRSWCGDQR